MNQKKNTTGDASHSAAQSAGQSPAAPQSGRQQDFAKDNLLQIPTIATPKGGGALKSIDEKFQVNAANGTASLTIRLPFARPRSDFMPQLALSYNSGAGNGIFGLGWSLGLNSIRRRTDKRLCEYRDTNESDVFQLSGAEDLVPKLIQDNKGHWNPDSFISGAYTIKRYCPRLESEFMLIEKITTGAGLYWKITSKDNLITFYGLSPAGRLADPADPSHIYEWFPEITYDDKGNCYQYYYVPEDKTNVPLLLHERNRLNGLQPFANTYLKSIRYGNPTPYSPTPVGGTPDPYSPVLPTGSDYLFQAVLDYGDHDPNTPTPTADTSWPARLDPFSNYKAGFEIRTNRLCRRILFFHNFKELDTTPVVVRSVDLSYRHFDFKTVADPYGLGFVEADQLVSGMETGWLGKTSAGYQRKNYPAMNFTYTLPVWDHSVQSCLPEDIPNAPEGLTTRYRFTDLWNEGIAGILSEHAEGWYYNSPLGDGKFGPATAICPKPSFPGLSNGDLQLKSVTGDGRKYIVNTKPPHLGFFEITDQEEWLPFKAFHQHPALNTKDPNIKYIDLNGDGMAEIVLSEEEVFTWWPADGIAGYDSPLLAAKPFDEEQGPAIVFADPVQSIFLADMTGDGLVDIVRIRNGELSYWPNMGFGKFGAKVNMSNAPVFDDPHRFNPAYLHLADINGTGATDVIYLGKNNFCAWLNLCGNAWGPAVAIDAFPGTASPNELSVADLLGNGTACIVWSSPLAGNADTPLRYIDLMGGKKPYLLEKYTNGMGKDAGFAFQSSTLFYLQDKLAGTPWITKLPFPVHVVTSVSVHDTISGGVYASSYTYHHGYYDHADKEFRGFGRVEQTDIDNFDTNAAADQAPVLVKTWYHTGAYWGIPRILGQLAHEYFQNPAFPEHQLPSPVLPADLSDSETREACRACKGMVLRQETYALDAAANPKLAPFPYSAIEHNNTITLLQPRGDNPYASYLSLESEVLVHHYERNPADPRIAQTLNTAYDAYGNLLQSFSVAYPRRTIDPIHPGGMNLPGNKPLPAEVITEQQQSYITCTRNTYTTALTNPGGAYRLPINCDSGFYQLSGIAPAGAYYTPADFASLAGSTLVRLKQQRTLFLADDMTTILPLTTMDTLGIPFQHYHLAFDATVTALGGKADAPKLAAAQYILSDNYKTMGFFPATDAAGEWWVPGGTIQYLKGGVALPFLLPYRYLDAYGLPTTLDYDGYWLLTRETTDALGNTTIVPAFDYRMLSPKTILDPNDNVTEYRFDVLGLLVGIALKGKGEGDVFDPGFATELSAAQMDGFFTDPVTNGPALLQGATTRYIYRFPSPAHPTIPFSSGSLTRTKHAGQPADPRVDITTVPYQFAFDYTDGMGRLAMGKVMSDWPAHPWLGKGKAVYNNKGNAVMQYEPFFSDTPAYEQAPANGVSPLLHYDPLGRLIQTDYANGSATKTEFDAWMEIIYDQNDTVLASGWYATNSTSADPLQVDAATKAAAHDSTPTTNHLDTLGRSIYTLAYNIVGGTPTLYAARTVLDLEGNISQLIDNLGNIVLQYDYDLLKRVIRQQSMDAGTRWLLHDCMDYPCYQWDVNNADSFVYTFQYDLLHRVLKSEVGVNGTPYLFTYNIYGEGISINGATDKACNLRNQRYRQFDDSGLETNYCFDFKGNLVQSSRIPTRVYRASTALPPAVSYSGVAATDMGLLERDAVTLQFREYIQLAQYDALNRPVLEVRPFLPVTTGIIIAAPYNQVSVHKADVIVRSYGKAGMLSTVSLYYQGGTVATPFVTEIRRNEKGQRFSIQFGNNTVTKYHYEPLTFRLRRLVTTRNGGAEILQDQNYYYDPVGNITYLIDKAQPPIFFNNQQVLSDNGYTYDATYRLISATGREQVVQNTVDESAANRNYGGYPFDAMSPLPTPSDSKAMRGYTQNFEYDSTGNMTRLRHVAGSGSYTRTFFYNNNATDRTTVGIPAATPMNNQLLATTVGANPRLRYHYDGHGNMTDLPQLSAMRWNFKDELAATTQQSIGGGAMGVSTYYTYTAEGMRDRKITEGAAPAGGNPAKIAERLYLGGFEVYRTFDAAGNLTLERATLHIMDDKDRIALIDNKTLDTGNADATTVDTPYARYQYSSHLNSSQWELDGMAKTVSYEEFHPFGTTSFQAADGALDIPLKRYRYTAWERDEETGLYYYGARYYAPWLCRWTAADPVKKINDYSYVANNPIINKEQDGKEWTRFWGGVQIVGGGVQTVLGAAVFVQIEVPVAAQVVGGIAVVHGVDDISTGWRQVVTGKKQDTATKQVTVAAAKGLGADEKTADAIGTGVDLAAGFVSPTGGITGLPKAALVTATNGDRVLLVTRVAADTEKVKQVVVAGQVLHMAVAGGKVPTPGGGSDDSGSSGSSGGSGNSGNSGKPAGAGNTPPNPANAGKATGATQKVVTAAKKVASGAQKIVKKFSGDKVKYSVTGKAKDFEAAKNGTGVYVLKDAQGNVLYVGEGNIFDRLRAHISDIDKTEWFGEIAKVEVHGTALTKKESVALEEQLIKELEPLHNKDLTPFETNYPGELRGNDIPKAAPKIEFKVDWGHE